MTVAAYDRPNAFTLIELIVVMILIGLLSTIVVYSVNGHVEAASMAQAADRWESLDRRLRLEARRSGQVVAIDFNTARQSFTVQSDANIAATGIKKRVSMPDRVRIESFRIARRNVATGYGSLKINALGQSKNYAVEMVTGRGATTWLVTLGTSGQQIRCRTEGEAIALLRP